jgi:YHS domain-containing protein
MGFLARVLGFLIWVLVLSWGVALLQRAVAWLLQGSGTVSRKDSSTGAESSAAARRLVRDPVCGVHVAEARALPLQTGTEIVHFCSAACRDRYLSQTRKMAANG